MSASLVTQCLGQTLASPIMNAAGVYCSTISQLQVLTDSEAGAVITKSATAECRKGNPEPRYRTTALGCINAMGLPNEGFSYYLDYSRRHHDYAKKPLLFFSVSGLTNEENVAMTKQLGEAGLPDNVVLELNLSCPNVVGKPQVGYDFASMEECLQNVSAVYNKPFGVKLPPYFDIAHFDLAAEVLNKFENVVFVSCINSVGNALVVDVQTQSAVIKPKNGYGGLGGEYVLPTALANVHAFYTRCPAKLVLGCGGVRSGADVFRHILAGATLVQLGTVLMEEGTASFGRCADELSAIMAGKGYTTLDQFRGKLRYIADTADAYFPGMIDCHVHFREPGHTYKADMSTEGAAARRGGIFVVCDMPNTSPSTTTIAALRDKVDRAARVAQLCDIRFFFGATEGTHLADLRELWTNPAQRPLRRRCCGLKLYLDHSTGNMKCDFNVVDAAFQLCSELDIPLVCHCESADVNAQCETEVASTSVEAHSQRRPVESEARSVAMAIDLARKYKSPLHVAHLSTAAGLEAVRQAKAEGLRVTCEVTPHHLFLTAEDYTILGRRIKVNAPVREVCDRDALWEGLLDGTVDCVATDHAPHTLNDKDEPSEPLSAPSGIPGVQFVLPLLVSVAAGKWPHPSSPAPPALRGGNQLGLKDIRRLMFDSPNCIFRLGAPEAQRLGVSLKGQSCISTAEVQSKCRWTPYDGWELAGTVAEIDSESWLGDGRQSRRGVSYHLLSEPVGE